MYVVKQRKQSIEKNAAKQCQIVFIVKHKFRIFRIYVVILLSRWLEVHSIIIYIFMDMCLYVFMYRYALPQCDTV